MVGYTHQQLNEEIRSIGGYYMVVEEGTLSHNGREVLYIVKLAKIESCCGTGGCGYILVPGYVIDLKGDHDDAGLPVSEVEPISDEQAREEIRKALLERYPHHDSVDFS